MVELEAVVFVGYPRGDRPSPIRRDPMREFLVAAILLFAIPVVS
jgi:hypothetical protein